MGNEHGYPLILWERVAGPYCCFCWGGGGGTIDPYRKANKECLYGRPHARSNFSYIPLVRPGKQNWEIIPCFKKLPH